VAALHARANSTALTLHAATLRARTLHAEADAAAATLRAARPPTSLPRPLRAEAAAASA